jgi:hypothetical protein
MIALACGYGAPDLGKLVAIDADTSEQAILAAALGALPQCRVARFGSKGWALLTRYQGEGDGRFAHIYQGEGRERRPLIEIKGMGQNITVPPSIHAKTGKPYIWINPAGGEPAFEGIPYLRELPIIGDGDIARLRQVMIDGGWATPPRPAPEPRANFDAEKIPKGRYEAWYRAGLRNARDELAGLREGGGRPTVLFQRVCALGASVHHGIIPLPDFEAAFLDACDRNGLSGREGRHAILATIGSGLRLAADDGLPDLGEPTARKRAKTKRKANGSGDTGDNTNGLGGASENESGDRASKRNGFDHDAEEPLGGGVDSRPAIEVHGGSLPKNVDDAILFLYRAKAPIYHQGGALVEPTRCSLVDNKGETVHVPAISRISAIGVRDAIGRYCQWQKYDGRAKRYVKINAPLEVAQIIHNSKGQGPHWRVLAGVATSPVLRRDATIANDRGFDEATGWFLQDLPNMPPMPPEPDEGDARRALEVLKPLLDEFPFTDSNYPDRPAKDTASYSVAMSAILSIPGRSMMNVAPGHIACASEAGTGKTYLFNIAAAIGLGTRCPIITQSKENEENEKRISAQMIHGAQIICIDNVNGELGGNLLNVLISENEVTARILGKSDNAVLTNRFIVFATGNNIKITGDLNRRMLICEMDAVLEHPCERRFDFDPVAEVFRDRGRYLAACLTIIRAHYLAGCPGYADLQAFAGFEEWSQIVRGALVWLGLRDPVDSMETLRQEDTERNNQESLVSALADLLEPQIGFPSRALTIAEIIEEAQRICDDGKDEARKVIKDLLMNYKDRFNHPDPRRIAKWFRRFIKRRLGNLRLREGQKKPMAKYFVEKVT